MGWRGVGTVVAIAVSLVAASPLARSQESFRVVGVAKGDVLNMRSSPNADASSTGAIPADASGIVRVGECKAWCQVRYGETVGWVNRRYLAPTKPSAQTPAPAQAPAPVPQSADPIGDCNSDDNRRRLAGCAALIVKGELSPLVLAIAHSRRSDAHVEARNLDAAIADRGKALELQPDDGAYKVRLAHAYGLRASARLNAGDLDGALADYGELIRLDPSHHEAYLARSAIYVRKKDYEKAIADVQVVAKLQGETVVHRKALAHLHEQRGVEHLLKKDPEAAIRAFTEALKLDPTRETVFLNRGAAYAAKNEVDRAEEDYAQVERLNPSSPEPLIRRGELARASGLLYPAMRHFDEALKRDPNNITARMLRGLTREETKQFDAAIVDYQGVLALDASHKLAKDSLVRLGGRAGINSAPGRRKQVGKEPE